MGFIKLDKSAKHFLIYIIIVVILAFFLSHLLSLCIGGNPLSFFESFRYIFKQIKESFIYTPKYWIPLEIIFLPFLFCKGGCRPEAYEVRFAISIIYYTLVYYVIWIINKKIKKIKN